MPDPDPDLEIFSVEQAESKEHRGLAKLLIVFAEMHRWQRASIEQHRNLVSDTCSSRLVCNMKSSFHKDNIVKLS